MCSKKDFIGGEIIAVDKPLGWTSFDAKSERGLVFLHSGLQLVDTLGGTPRAYHHDACGKRVEGTGMPYLHFLKAEFSQERAAKPLHGIERSPATRH